MRKRFKELCIEVTKKREELKEQRELIDFLLEHDRNDVVLDWTAERFNVYTVIKYIYDNKIKVVSTKLPYECGGYEVIENTAEKIVIKFLFYTFVHSHKFYKITKKDGIIMDITDIVDKTKEDERKKVEAELDEKSKQEESTTVANPDTPTDKGEKMVRIEIDGKSSMTNREYAREMRKICNDKHQDIAVNGELWLAIIERLENQDMFDEVAELKKEIESALCRAEGLERQNFILNNECEEGRKIVEFQKGKIEAYEFVFRCLGGKDGN